MNPKLLGSLLVGIIILTGVYIGSLTLKQPLSENVFTNQQAQVGSSLPTGQIGYWNFDAGSGTTASDSQGGNTLSFIGSPTWISGRTGQALSFSGNGAALRDSSISLSSPAVTTAFWLKNDSWGSNNAEIVELSDNTNNTDSGFGIYYNGAGSATGCSAGQIAVSIKGNVGYNASCYATPGAGAWHHYAFIFDKGQTAANEIAFYIDGSLQTPAKSLFSSDNTNNFSTNSFNVMTRAGEGAPTFAGTLDDLRLYSKALSASEVGQLVSYVSVPTDTTAPTLSSVAAGSVTATGATISWTTNEAADDQVEYGLTTAYGSNTILNATLGTSHSVPLSGLTANTVYHYHVKSRDAAGNQAISADGTFTTATPVLSSSKFTLTVVKPATNTGTGIIRHSGYINCGYVCSNSTVPGNEAISLQVIPDAGSTFTGWTTGPCAGTTANPCNFSMSGATTVTPVFTSGTPTTPPPAAPVTTFSASPTSMTAGQTSTLTWTSTGATSCMGSGGTFAGATKATSGTFVVTPTATTAYGLTCTGAGGTSLIKNVTVTVTPVTPATYSVTVIKAGTGAGTVTSTGSINCGVTCSSTGTSGQTVTLTAAPGANSTFSGWTGVSGCSTATTCSFVLSANTTVTATFAGTSPTYSVSVTKSGTGLGTVTSTGSINCGTACTANGTSGQTVTLTATPNSSSVGGATQVHRFVGWSGSCTGTATTCSFTLNSNSTVNAEFALIIVDPLPFTVTTTKAGTGAGTVTCSPASCSSIAGSPITVTASPSIGSTLTGMSVSPTTAGTCTSSSCTVVGAGTVTVTFTAIIPTAGPIQYIRAGATGNGSDWNNAYGSIPTTLTRGVTYFIADGTYATGGYNFDDAVSGTQLITIKKATASDHGTDTGWTTSTMGVGTAIFNGGIKVSTPYYVFDGATRGADWRSGYGIKINTNGQAKGVDFYNGCVTPSTGLTCSTAGNITLRNIEIVGNGMDNTTYDDGIFAAWGTNNVTISNAYIHDTGRTGILTGHLSNWLLEYSIIARNSSTVAVSTAHGSAWAGTMDSNIVVRYNRFEDIEGTAFLDWVDRGEGGVDANFEIYGNTFLHSEGNPYNREGVTDGTIVAINTQVAQNWKIYNNTFININNPKTVGGFWHDGISIGNLGVGNRDVLVYNNYWWGGRNAVHTITNCSTNCVVSNNRYDGVAYNTAETNVQANATANTGVFVDYANKNFHLTAPTATGLTLAAPYNVDMDGTVRGAGGTWDRGAYEYTGAAPTNPAPTVSLSANPTSITAGQSSTLTWSSTNATSCTGTGGTFTGARATSGTLAVSPTANVSYGITCTGAGGSATSPSVAVTVGAATPNSTTFSAGNRVQTTDVLNVRASASVSGTLLGAQALGSLGTIIGGGTFADTYYWWNITYDTGVSGWSVENYLTKYTPTVTTFTVATSKVGTGAGTVTCNPTTCSANTGSPVTVTAAPAAGSTFTGWSGACTGTGTCTLTSAGTVTATFTLIPQTGPLGIPGNTCSGTCYYVTPTGAGNGSGSNWANAMRGLTNAAPNADWLSNNVTLVGGATYYLAGGTYQPSAYSFRAHSGGMTYVVKATVENSGLVLGWSDSYANQARLGALLIFGDNYSFDGVYRNETKWDDAASYGFSASWTKVDSRPLSTAANPVGPTGNHVSFKYFSIGAADAGPGGWSSYPGHAFEYYKQSGTPLTDYYMGYSYLHTFSDVPIRFNNTTGAVVEYNFIGPSYTKEALRGDAGVSNITIRHNIFQNNCQDIPNSFPGGNDANGCTAEIGPWDQGYYDNWKIYGNVFKDTISIPHSDAAIFGGTYSIGDPGHKARNWEVYNNVFTGMTGGGAFNRINIDGTNNSVHDNFWYNNGPASGITCDAWGGSTTCTNNKIVTSVTEAYANILPVISAQVR